MRTRRRCGGRGMGLEKEKGSDPASDPRPGRRGNERERLALEGQKERGLGVSKSPHLELQHPRS